MKATIPSSAIVVIRICPNSVSPVWRFSFVRLFHSYWYDSSVWNSFSSTISPRLMIFCPFCTMPSLSDTDASISFSAKFVFMESYMMFGCMYSSSFSRLRISLGSVSLYVSCSYTDFMVFKLSIFAESAMLPLIIFMLCRILLPNH